MNATNIKKKAAPILKNRGVLRAGLFGSFARGEEKKNSDIDILVQLKKGSSLLDLVRIEQELSDTLGRKVDLVTYKSLHPFIKKDVLAQEQKIV